jgi:hypothetical protein
MSHISATADTKCNVFHIKFIREEVNKALNMPNHVCLFCVFYIVRVQHNCGIVFVAIVLMIHTADVLYNCGHIFVSIVLMIHTVDIPYSWRIVLVYIVLMNHDVYGFFMIVASCLP